MKKLRAVVGALLVVSILGCTTLVQIQTDPKDAKVYIDNQPIGKSPVTKDLSNFVFNEYLLRIEKPGYKPLITELHREVKVGNLVVGILLCWPLLLWCYGPDQYYTYELEED
jgi:hypothetical protein